TDLEKNRLLEDSDSDIVYNEEYIEDLDNIVNKLEQLQVNEKKSRRRKNRVREDRARGIEQEKIEQKEMEQEDIEIE
ncbi:9225_t:CDS:1, partial [Acaulospora morrowiae]